MAEKKFELRLEGSEEFDHKLTPQLGGKILVEVKLLYNNIEVVLKSVLQTFSNFNESDRVDASRPVTMFYLDDPFLQLCKFVTDKLFISESARN